MLSQIKFFAAISLAFAVLSLPGFARADLACGAAQQALNCHQFTAFQGSPEQDTFVDFSCYAQVCSNVTRIVIQTGSQDNMALLCQCDNIATDTGEDGARLSCVQSAVLTFCGS